MACKFCGIISNCLLGVVLYWTLFSIAFGKLETKEIHTLGILDTPSLYDMGDVIYKVENITGLSFSTKTLLSDITNNYSGYKKALSSIRDVYAVIGPYSKEYAEATTKQKIPYLVTSITPSDQEQTPFLIQIFPDVDVLAEAVLDIVKYFHYHHVAVIHDTIEGGVILEKLLRQPLSSITSFKINDSSSEYIRQELKDIRSNYYTNIIVVCKNNTSTDRILTEGLRLSMFSHPHTWLLVNTGLEEYDLEKYVDSRVNLTVLDLTADPGSISCHLKQDINLKRAVFHDAVRLYVNLKKNSNQDKSMRTTVGKLDLQGCTGHLNFTRFGKRFESSLRLLEIRNYRTGESGSWTNIEDHFINRVKPSESYSSSRRFSNMFDKPLRITTKIEPPFVQFKNESNYSSGDPNFMFEGLLIDILEELSKLLGFSYNLSLVPDGKFGSLKPPPRFWTGMVRVIIDDKADLALAPFQVTPDRSNVVDFTKPFMTKGTTTMVKRPEFKVGHFQFLRPLSKYVWIAIFVSFVCVSLILFAVSRVNSDKHAKYTHNLRASFWYIWGTLLRGSLCGAPRAVSSRTVSSAWWFFSLIIISIYTANLAAFLTITISSIGINSAADLANQDVLQYGTVEGSQIEYFFNHTKMDHYAKMKATMSVQPNWMVRTVAIGYERVMQGGYAFIWDSPTISHLVSTDCSLMEIGTPFDLKGYGLAVKKNAPYLEKISMAILKMIEDGVTYRLEGKWWRRQNCPDPRQKAKTKSLDFENVAGMFIILACGTVLAVIICLITYCIRENRARLGVKNKVPFVFVASKSSRNDKYTAPVPVTEIQEDRPDMLGDIQVYANHSSYGDGPFFRHSSYSEYESKI